MFKYFDARPKIAFWCIWLVLATLLIFLPICYHLARINHHLWDDSNEIPAISSLGNHLPEYWLFAAGFAVVSLLGIFCMWFRARQLHSLTLYRSNYPLSNTQIIFLAFNWIIFGIGVSSLCLLTAMAYTDYPETRAALHFILAGISVGLLSIYLVFVNLLATFMLLISRLAPNSYSLNYNSEPDSSIDSLYLRLFLYLLPSTMAGIALYWFIGWQDRKLPMIYEWMAFGMLMCSLCPLSALFFRHKSKNLQSYNLLPEA